MVASASETLIDILRTQSIHGLHLGMTDKQIKAQIGKPDYIEVPYVIEDEDIWKQRNWYYKDLLIALKENKLFSMLLQLRYEDILVSEELQLETSNALRNMKHQEVVSLLKNARFNLKFIDDPFFLDWDDYDEREIFFLPDVGGTLQFNSKNHYCLHSISIRDETHYGRWKLVDC